MVNSYEIERLMKAILHEIYTKHGYDDQCPICLGETHEQIYETD